MVLLCKIIINKLVSYFPVLILLLITLEANAKKYILSECFTEALKKNNKIAIQGELINQAEAQLKQTYSIILPTLNATAVYTPSQARSISNSFGLENQILTKLTLSQPLFQGFKEFAAIRQSKALKESTILDKKNAELVLYKNVAQSFVTVLSNENDLKNLRKEIEDYEKRVEELEKFKRIGRARETDVLSAKAIVASLKAQIQQIQGQISVQREILSYLTGFEKNVSLQDDILEFETIPWDVEKYLKNISNRYDIKSAQQKIIYANENINVQRAGYWPNLGMSFNYYLERPAPYKNINWDLSLNLSISLYDGSLTANKVEEALAIKSSNTFNLSDIQNEAKQNISTYHSNVKFLNAQLQEQKIAVELAEKNYHTQLKDNRLGLVTNPDLLQSLATYQGSKRSYDILKYNCYLNLLQLNAESGFVYMPDSSGEGK